VIGVKINIRVNNTTHELSADSRLTLLDALRDVLGQALHRIATMCLGPGCLPSGYYA
jgi:aerobic-type carbon monoxide dehydrogenase small subunit (CoxS/CutS family)